MCPATEEQFPKLRPVETTLVRKGGRTFVAIRDPLLLTDKTVLVPQEISPLLALCDGTRDAGALSAGLAVRFGQNVPVEAIADLLSSLDEVLLLDNQRYVEARQKALAEYRRAPHRAPVLASHSYPAEPDELREFLDGYLEQANVSSRPGEARGLVSPHIDYLRGGHVYAKVWGGAQEAAREADLAIVFGTGHYSAQGRITLTRQHYATPFGVLPTATAIVENLAEGIKGEAVFDGELCHKGEHSIELALVWLHHMRGGRPCEILPVLCGTFDRFVSIGVEPENDPQIKKLVERLGAALGGRRALVIAAADLSHVGPAFGGRPLDLVGRANLASADEELMGHMRSGEAGGFLDSIRRVEDRNNVCGVVPIYLAMRLLSPTTGEVIAYDRCPADAQGTSLVSICGVIFD